MGKTVLIVLGVLAIPALLVVSLFFGWLSFSNQANAFENDIPMQYREMQNVYDNGWKQVMEDNQVSANYSDGFKDAFQSILRGDPKGQQAMLQVLTAMPNYDSGIFRRVMDSIDGFHKTFSSSQSKLISEKQEYGKMLTATTTGRLYNNFSHYPHIKCGVPDGTEDSYAILTSDKTDTDFRRHKADALDLRNSGHNNIVAGENKGTITQTNKN